MSNQYPLSKLGEFRNGLNFTKHTVKHPCKMIGIPDFGDYLTPNYSALGVVDKNLVSSDYLLQDGDILFVRSNGNKNLVGRTMIIQNCKEDISYSGFCIRFRPNIKLVFPMYLLYVLRSPLFRKRFSQTQQSNINNINQDTLGEYVIDLPDYSMQTSMANAMEVIDRKIALNKAINAELEKTAKLLYNYWFVQFDFPDENGKPYRASGGAMEYNEQLKREIPKGWEVSSIEELLAPVTNSRRLQTDEYLDEGTIPIIDQSRDYIIGFTNSQDAIVKNLDEAIVFGDHTRVLKYVNFEFARGADGTQVIVSNTKSMPQILFYFTLKSFDLSNYGYSRHFKFLKEQLAMIPCKEIAIEFNAIVSPWYKLITQNRFTNYELTALRDFLLPLLMNGQVTVKTD